MKTFLECTDLAAREVGDTGFKNWLTFKLDAEQLEHLERAAVIYAEQSNSHKHSVMQAEGLDGANGAAVASEGQGEANTCADCGRTKDEDGTCYSCEYGAMFGH